MHRVHACMASVSRTPTAALVSYRIRVACMRAKQRRANDDDARCPTENRMRRRRVAAGPSLASFVSDVPLGLGRGLVFAREWDCVLSTESACWSRALLHLSKFSCNRAAMSSRRPVDETTTTRRTRISPQDRRASKARSISFSPGLLKPVIIAPSE